MILSVSKRTDIPARYSEWFMNNLRKGSFQVRNPYFPNQVTEYRFSKEAIDAIVFWSKNPQPLYRYLDELNRDYNCLFLISVNDYPKTIEAYVPSLRMRLNDFQDLARRTKPGSVVWRYDPVILTDTLTVGEHLKSFSLIAKALSGHTNRCIVSLVDPVKKAKDALRAMGSRQPDPDELEQLITGFRQITEEHGMTLQACAEPQLIPYGLNPGACIDQDLLNRLFDLNLKLPPSRERDGCLCAKSVDIGAYDSCLNGCAYCYANKNHQTILRNVMNHDKNSKMLIGKLGSDDTLRIVHETEPLSKSFKKLQWDF